MRKKVYGSYRVDTCPFCQSRALTKNSQQIPVCSQHKNQEATDLKCVCGEWLMIKEGKWGVFGLCLSCGPVSWSKLCELNPNAFQLKKETKKEDQKKQNEFIIRSDDPLYFD
ncbi:hypothetical protein CMO92_03720 [Candidatus Woesearchaeota archaeon]|nr:hypothetical protein [Candidatus Woesearchaeota archaeon]|tara:strand:+ start:176 stop:511 length:336 start_codon:yes stop_codon:yes gene_type:complete